MSNGVCIENSKIAWNLSYENFKTHGTDYPSFVDFRGFFGDGAFVAWLPKMRLPMMVDPLLVVLELAHVERNLNQIKWEKLKLHIQNGGSVCPPWAKIFGGRLWIYQGIHRFHMAVIGDAKTIPVVVSRFDAEYLRVTHGCRVESMPA